MKNILLSISGLLLITFTNLKAQNSSNAVYGFQAGDHMQYAENNTYIGSLSGGINYNGNNNTLIGYSAGYESENGSNNTYLGTFSGHNCTGSDNIFVGYRAGMNETGNNKLYIENSNSAYPLIWGDFTSDLLKLNGKVGIGTAFGNFPTTAGGVTISNYSLFVKGGILTEEVRVNLQSAWADYVFQPEYKLPTLAEVEKHILDKGHLINVPSATQVAEEGIALGEMTKIQQEKIEELTLYILQQNKINEVQNQKLEKQSKEIDELKKLVQNLIDKK
ncbi:MAG TPA: hypothetical protein PK776_01465 [Flavobacterium sp.]|nr:hypothetical protein [Flavobacterium sp.]